jgi:hypothetical protein
MQITATVVHATMKIRFKGTLQRRFQPPQTARFIIDFDAHHSSLARFE